MVIYDGVFGVQHKGMKKMSKLLLVRWVDSSMVSEWEGAKDAFENASVYRINSVGWEVYRDDEVLLLAPHVSDRDPADFTGHMRIPIVCIEEEVELLAKREEVQDEEPDIEYPGNAFGYEMEKVFEVSKEVSDKIGVPVLPGS